MSTVELTRMEWGNMFSYAEDNFLDLAEERVYQILGVNGVGKSSIPTILEEALYSKNSKGFKKAEIPNRYINDPYYVNVDFKVDDISYRLEITKKSTLKATLYKDGEDISAHTASGTIKMFEELCKLDFKTFTQLVYQNTDSSLQFLTATDSKRKEFLVNLFDMAEYGEKQKKFSNVLKEVNTDITKLSGKIDSVRSTLTRLESQVNVEIGDLIPEEESPDHLIEEKAELESALKSIEDTNRRIQAENKILTELSKLRSKEDILKDLESLGEVPEEAPLVENLGRKNSTISAAKAVIKKIEGLSGQCPTCLQTVDEHFIDELLRENNDIIDSNREQATKIVKELEDIKDQKRKVTNLRNELRQRENIESRKVSETYQELRDPEDLEDKIRDLSENISSIRSSITKARSHNSKVEQNQAKKQAAEEQLDTLNEELEKHIEELGVLEKRIGPLETLKKAFSSTGLVAYKLENRVKDLESNTNEYLSKLSDGQFNLAFELSNDKLNVVIYDKENPVSMTALSSGEKARVVISTLLGIRKIMQYISKTTLNVLFLDEVISVMDDLGKEQLIEVLLEEEGLNTFVVSHGWSHPLVAKIDVVKEDDISVIRR